MANNTKRNKTIIVVTALLLPLTLLGCTREVAALGTQQQPLVWLLSPAGDIEELHSAAEQIATTIYELTGYHITPSIADSEAAVVAALGERPPAAHITTLSSAAYLHASDQGNSAAALLGTQGGEQYYNGYFITNKDSGIEELADLFTGNLPTPRMATAELGSLGGYVMPLVHLREAGLDPENESFSFVEYRDDERVLAAVYLREAATGTITRNLLEELSATEGYEDIVEQVSIFGRTHPIPLRGLQFSSVVPQVAQRQILNALLQLNEQPNGRELISGLYEWEALSEHGDEPYEPLRELMRSTSVSLEELRL